MGADLFPGFASNHVASENGTIFARSSHEKSADRPTLVLLHGFPQTHAMWHRIAPELARTHQVIAMDLRGYGWSSAPRGNDTHEAYSKRAMAEDVLRVVEELGHARFALAGHDRGARVAYRLALDHPGRLSHLALLDIVPTITMWERIEAGVSAATAHWPFLAGPSPEPENAILADPIGWMEAKLSSWSKAQSLAAFDPRALRLYRDAFNEPSRIHAFCEDYRAGATLDRAQDQLSRAKGETIDCPVLVLWGDAGIPASGASPLDAWKVFAPHATGVAVSSGHFLAEENPAATLDALKAFL